MASTPSSDETFEDFLSGGFDGGDISGGAKKKKRGLRRGGALGEMGVVGIIIGVLVFIAFLFFVYYLVSNTTITFGKGFESYAGGSGINIGGSCCKTYHTPSLTEIEYPASDGCGTCNSGCNLRYDTSSNSSEGFAVSDLASYDNGSAQSGNCCGPSVRVSGCSSNQLGPYEMSENVLAQSLFTN